jgi:hypothetical protein
MHFSAIHEPGCKLLPSSPVFMGAAVEEIDENEGIFISEGVISLLQSLLLRRII